MKKYPKNEFDNKNNYPSMPSKGAIQRAGHEIKENEPAVVAKTRRKKGAKAANKQRIAILLNKARRRDY